MAQKAVSGLKTPTPNGDCSYGEDGRAKRRLDRGRQGASLRRGCNFFLFFRLLVVSRCLNQDLQDYRFSRIADALFLDLLHFPTLMYKSPLK